MKMLEFLASEDPDLFVVLVHPGVYSTDMLADAKMEDKLSKEMLDDMSLVPHFLVWVISPEARFLKGRFVCANWDVDELVGKKKDIESSRILESNLHGWPYGKGMDAMLAQAEGEK